MEEELLETLEDAYQSALRQAALEAFESRYESEEIEAMISKEDIIKRAINLIGEDNN